MNFRRHPLPLTRAKAKHANHIFAFPVLTSLVILTGAIAIGSLIVAFQLR